MPALMYAAAQQLITIIADDAPAEEAILQLRARTHQGTPASPFGASDSVLNSPRSRTAMVHSSSFSAPSSAPSSTALSPSPSGSSAAAPGAGGFPTLGPQQSFRQGAAAQPSSPAVTIDGSIGAASTSYGPGGGTAGSRPRQAVSAGAAAEGVRAVAAVPGAGGGRPQQADGAGLQLGRAATGDRGTAGREVYFTGDSGELHFLQVRRSLMQ
jgi:hypothetical protein